MNNWLLPGHPERENILKRILLIDDEPGILQLLRTILTDEGYSVETAWTSKEALERASSERFDLVVTDFNMPEMKGDELALNLKSRWPGLPVVMLTGSAGVLRALGRVMPGVDLLVDKPFNVIQFCEHLAMLLDRSEDSGISRHANSEHAAVTLNGTLSNGPRF